MLCVISCIVLLRIASIRKKQVNVIVHNMSIYFYWAETHRTSPMFRRSAFKRWASKMTLNASESPHFCYRQFNVMTFFISVECLTLYSFCKWYTFTISLEDLSVDCIMVTLFFWEGNDCSFFHILRPENLSSKRCTRKLATCFCPIPPPIHFLAILWP